MMWRCVNSSLALPPTKSFAKCAWWLSVLTASFVLGFALSMFIGDLDAISLWKQLQVADRILPRFNATYMPEPQHENSRVLLLAYPRSGSSFTGQLLLSGDPSNTWYNFEPLTKFTPLVEFAWQQEDYYNASKLLSSKFRARIQKRFEQSEDDKRVKIEKTIRLRWHHIEDWICDTDIKIIHLVRDPRAMLYSMHKMKQSFFRYKEHPEILCEFMHEDLKMETELSPSRYMRVEYNDLVSQDDHVKDQVTRRLFEFIGIPYTKEVAENVDKFRQGWGELKNKTEKEKDQQAGFFGVYRPDNYDPNHWKKNIKSKVLADFNKACGRTLKAMNYDLGSDYG